MRCFFSCFGFSKTKKRRKSSYKIHGSYEPLDSDAKVNLKSKGSASDFRGSKVKEISRIGVKKNVSFNLNVKSYEPLPQIDLKRHSSESEDENYEENKNETLGIGTFPSNHRYQNLEESDDDMALYESDEDEYGSDDEEISEEYDESKNGIPVVASLDEELKKLGYDSKVKLERSEYVFNVLDPIENLAQWKVVKAKTPMQLKQQRKENTSSDYDFKANTNQVKPQNEDNAMNTSLSNWLASSK